MNWSTDDDGGGTIDINEFKEHCYNIPRLAWKAEKIRFEREKTKSIEDAQKMAEREAANLPLTPSGSMGAIMHALEDHHHQKDGAAAAATDENMQSSEIIYEGTKLFWRTHEKIDIVMHEYVPTAHRPPPSITVHHRLPPPPPLSTFHHLPPPSHHRPPPSHPHPTTIPPPSHHHPTTPTGTRRCTASLCARTTQPATRRTPT